MSSTLRSIGIETAKTLYDTIRGRDSNFLFFLGGAETVTENKNTIDDDNVIWENINFLQKVRDTDVSIVARRVNWSSGTVYYPYDSSGIPESGMSGGEKNYYVMNEDNEVFVCMSANARNRKDQFGLSNSTVKPTRGNNNTVLSDGYRWKFLYKVDLAEGRFLTKTYMPVPDLNEYTQFQLAFLQGKRHLEEDVVITQDSVDLVVSTTKRILLILSPKTHFQKVI